MIIRQSTAIIACITCAVLIIATNVGSANSEVILFEDDFESYGIGTYPSPSWNCLFGGAYGYVTNENAYSGEKSYKAQGQYGWSRNDIVSLPTINKVGYEIAICPQGQDTRVCLYNRNVGSWGSHDASVSFSTDGKVYAGNNEILANYDINQWYLIRVEVNFEEWLMDVYINGELIAEDVSALTEYPTSGGARYNCLNLESLWESAPGIYYDDVKVFDLTNQPPIADVGESYQTTEGSTITFDASASSDPDGNALQYRWDFDNDGTWDTDWSNNPTDTHTWNDDWSGTVTVEVSDGELSDTDTASVVVNNVAPTITVLSVPLNPVAIGNSITINADFLDPGSDEHTAKLEWGDGESTDINSVSGTSISADHYYATPGIYRVVITVTDDDEGEDIVSSEEYVVIFDAEGGFVTGGGWIDSPAGAYVPDTTVTGKATFGFVSKYQKGATVPTGNTEFQFKVANLNFKFTSYDWLVVAGAQAKYKGTGTINGLGEYGFMLSAVDGAIKGDNIDMFRIKIWDKASGEVVYDNQMDALDDADPTTAIGSGSIVVHKVK